MTPSLIEAAWRIYASANYTTIDSDNSLSPVRQVSIWTNADVMSIGLFGINLSEISNIITSDISRCFGLNKYTQCSVGRNYSFML